MMRALRLVSDDHDDAAIAQELHARGRASDSALVVTPTPGRAGEGIGRDLLSAMGKRFDAPGTPRKPEVLLDRADSWMRARSIDQLVVCHAERLTSAVRTRLTTLGPEHATLWLIDDPTMTPNKPAEDPQGSPASMTELLAVIGNSKMHNAPVASDLECSRAPDVDYPFFALACRRAGAEVLFANLVLGRNHALRLIDHAGTRPGPDVVNRLLTGAAQCAVGTDAKIARIRGAQLELLKSASIHTRIDAAELRARMTAHALSAPDPKTRRLLDGYVEPLPAALAAASVCTGRGPAWLSELTFGDLGHDRIGDYRVPVALRSFLQLLRLDQRPRDQPVFGADGKPFSASRLRATLKSVMRRTHLRLNVALERHDPEPRLATVHHVGR